MSHVWNEHSSSFLTGKVYGVLVLFLVTLVAPVFCSASVVAVEPGSATTAVKKTLDQVLAILGDEQLKTPDRSRDRIAALEKIIGERFDYEEMGKRTLGFEWKKLDRSQPVSYTHLTLPTILLV